MKKENESGSVMVEATIYFPIVIMIVALIICVSIAKIEESILYFETEKIAYEAARDACYAGYDQLIDLDNVSMKADLGNIPDSDKVGSYYGEQTKSIYNIHFDYSEKQKNYESRLAKMVDNFYFLRPGIVQPECDVSIKGGLVPRVEVEVIYHLNFPKMFEYLVDGTDSEGMFSDVKITSHSRALAMNPTEFVRNIDIAFDIGDYIAKKFGFDDNINGFMDKLKALKDKIM